MEPEPGLDQRRCRKGCKIIWSQFELATLTTMDLVYDIPADRLQAGNSFAVSGLLVMNGHGGLTVELPPVWMGQVRPSHRGYVQWSMDNR